VTAELVSLLGDDWTYERSLAGGGAGAVLVRRPNGSLAVVKFSGGSSADAAERVDFVRKLRSAGYPTPDEDEPRVLSNGLIACVTDFVPDAMPVDELTDALVDDLLGLARLQTGLVPGARGWPDWLRRSLSDGLGDWCRPAVVRADARCAGLAVRASRWAEPAAALPEADGLIHGDLHQGNLLVCDGRLASIIDCVEVRPGDPRFDLVTAMTIAANGPVDMRQRLREVVEARVAATTLTVYTAHHGVRLLDWALTWAPDQVDLWAAVITEEFDRYEV
jgi:hypothetical protein